MSVHTLFKNGLLIDGCGKTPVPGSSVLVKSRLIEAVGEGREVTSPQDARVVDLAGLTIMPGLIDAHVHLWGLSSMAAVTWVLDDPTLRAMRAVMDAWKVVDMGFTTVRDCGGVNGLLLKQGIEQGQLVGPRILAAGRVVTQTGGHGDPIHFLPVEWSERSMVGLTADGVGEVRKVARSQLRAGADFLKIMTTGGVMSERDVSTSCQFSLEEIRAFVEEAKNAEVRTASHAQGTLGIKNALHCGIDSIEHGFYLDEECIELMLKNGAALVPTLAVVDAIANKGSEAGVIQTSVEKARVAQKAHLASFKKAYKAGVLCGLGTDYLTDPMTPMGENAVELELYVTRAGLSPMETIVCATRNNAQVLGLADKLGTLEPRKWADFLVVDGDPSRDISVLRDKEKILDVYKEGSRVPRLDKLGVRGIE